MKSNNDAASVKCCARKIWAHFKEFVASVKGDLKETHDEMFQGADTPKQRLQRSVKHGLLLLAQLCLIMGVYAAGCALASVLPITLPGNILGIVLLLVLLGSWWGVRRRDRAAEQEAEAEHLLAGAGEPNALPRRWVTLFWSQRSSIAESRWAGMVESSLIIGSDAAQCDLCLPDRKVSPQHCVLAAQGDALLVQPLSDRAKVYVNGERIDGEHRLQNNDTLRIGKTTVRLVL